ncbi:S8 family serine peptidase [Flavobacterium jejuense]|uniref:S8 family serine peptidase n=1 Tax=Flavobacterium jejuense TaxID=1544455 RepID=A0ABX0IVQ1_9FLAO|nr:S8 family serine peptidase [Flavobacterium jejuense]NHN26847.1 S8 family serine peptidase [Flavobacterium jejuense]
MRKLGTLLFLLLSFCSFAQEDAWVYFTDKPDEVYYTNNPLEMLSQRALDRRTTQNIALDIKDIPISQTYINQIAATSGITIMAKSKWLNALHIRGTQFNIQSLEALNFVDHIQFANHSLNPSTRNDNPSSSNRNNEEFEIMTNFNYGNSNNQIQMLNGHLLHQQDYTGQGKVIAILDAGFPGVDTASSFQRLRDNNLILGGYNFPDRNTNFYTRYSHGTNVLSTMGGFVDGQLVGTAPDAEYYLFITEDTTSENPVEESYWVEALEMADSLGVDVINSSLGYTDYDNSNYSYSYSQRNGQIGFASRGASIALSKGIVCVVSAGNDGNTSEKHISIPADADNILTIGAVTNTEAYASFSSIGPSFDGRVKPDVCAKGQSATISNTVGTITTASGTSFSSPILAGMVASFWSALPNLTASEVIQYVKQSADQYNNPDIFKGYGVPDFQLALNNALNIESFPNIEIVLYPNPVKKELFIKLNNSSNGEFNLYNNLGQKVLQVSVFQNQQNISLEHLSSGIYIYDFSTNNTNLQGKLIKQ